MYNRVKHEIKVRFFSFCLFLHQFRSLDANSVHVLQGALVRPTLRRRLDKHFRLRRDLQLLGADALHPPRHGLSNLGILARLRAAVLRLRLAARASPVDLSNAPTGQQTLSVLRSSLPIGPDQRVLRGVFLQRRRAALWVANGPNTAVDVAVLVSLFRFR